MTCHVLMSCIVAVLLIAAFAHAGWNFAAKPAGDGGAVFVWLYQTLSSVIYLPMMIGALLLTDSPPT